MNGDIAELNFDQLLYILRNAWRRRVTSIHVHHTWKPRAWQWTGRDSVEAIKRYHTENNGWSDIAQHLTIGPDGSLWTGRHLDRSPASAAGHNGDRHAGPLMIEMIGDFDLGQDQFRNPQARSTYRAIAAICERFSLDSEKVRFHREFNRNKSCPGTSLSLDKFRLAVQAEISKATKARGIRAEVIEGLVPPVPEGVDIEADAHAEPAESSVRGRGELYDDQPPAFTEEDIARFTQHVVNTEMGKLSQGGHFASSSKSLNKLIRSVDEWAQKVDSPRIVLFAHGGLVSELTALRKIVERDRQWWLDNGVYPIFFVWETGLLEVIFGQSLPRPDGQLPGERGFKDWLLENALGKTIGRSAWERMKASAFLMSRKRADDNESGGGYLFADKFTDWLAKQKSANKKKKIEVHAVAHSAGAIVMCHLLPVLDRFSRRKGLLGNGKSASTDSLSFLAPACRTDLFVSNLLPLISSGRIGQCAQFAMQEATERDDTVAKIYGMSLLYMVRNACEHGQPGILGLEESIRSNASLSKFFGLTAQAPATAELILSPTGSINSGKSASQSTTHGGFDDDAATMNSVLGRILGLEDGDTLPAPRLPGKRSRKRGSSSATMDEANDPPLNKVHALCIGIDKYNSSPLNCCVADAKLWAGILKSRGAELRPLLLDSEATKARIVEAWTDMCDEADRGDTIVIQFAGHGTQVPDYSGDETDYYDEAWVTYDFVAGEVLTDDEIGGLIDRYEAKALQFILFTDCCHSGTGTRARGNPTSDRQKSRFLPLKDNAHFVRAYREASQRWALKLNTRSTEDLGPEIHFAGCQDEQSSYESNGQGHFTKAATLALKDQGRPMSYRDLADQIIAAFREDNLQRPNFRARSGRAKKPVFRRGTESGLEAGSPRNDCHCPDLVDRLGELERRVQNLARDIDELE